MKIRITALFCIMALLLTLLPGCGAAESEPEVTTMTTTEVSTTEPTVEPTTEPTTEPTEPPTALEQLGFDLWEDASDVSIYGSPDMNGVRLPTSQGLGGEYNDFKVYFHVSEENGRILEELVTAPMSVTIYEFPASSFDDDIDWMKEKLEPFYQYSKEQGSSGSSFEEWVNANQDKKLLWMHSFTEIDGTELWLKAGEEGFGRSTYGTSIFIWDLVNPVTGERFSPVDDNYDVWNNSVVGAWKQDQYEGEILALSAAYFSGWFGDYEMHNNVSQDMYVLLPAELEDICFVIPEYATVEAHHNEDSEDPETDAMWETGNILEDYDLEKRNYYFIGFN